MPVFTLLKETFGTSNVCNFCTHSGIGLLVVLVLLVKELDVFFSKSVVLVVACVLKEV